VTEAGFTGSRLIAPDRPRVVLDGIALDACSERELVDTAVTAAAEGRGGWIVTVNVDILRSLHDDQELKSLIAPATFVVADGMPLVWSARLAGTPLPERVTGASLIWSLTRAAAGSLSVYILGGPPGVAALAAAALKRECPALRVAGTSSPPMGFEHDEGEFDAAVAAVVDASPDIVFAGFGFPKQEAVIARLRHELPQTWFLGCGAAVSFAAGVIPRAPAWMQRTGLEWVYRLRVEPTRLFRRYVVNDLPFGCSLFMRALASRGRRAFARSER
jgi:N-acetylglucosaminyldiphosphoundecaprenol N-acetyl-beta-D-mannosaminyltransferase